MWESHNYRQLEYLLAVETAPTFALRAKISQVARVRILSTPSDFFLPHKMPPFTVSASDPPPKAVYGSGVGDAVGSCCRRSLLTPEVSWINAAARCAASALLVGPKLALAPARPDGPKLGFLCRQGLLVGSVESALMLLRRLLLKLRPRALSPSTFAVGYPYRYCELLKLAALLACSL